MVLFVGEKMKVKALIAYLQQFDGDQDVELYELSGLYDSILLSISQEYGKVVINIKNIIKNNENKEIH